MSLEGAGDDGGDGDGWLTGVDYGTPLTVIFFTGYQYFGKMRRIPVEHLPISKAFFPTSGRDWFIRFWEIDVGDVFLAIP